MARITGALALPAVGLASVHKTLLPCVLLSCIAHGSEQRVEIGEDAWLDRAEEEIVRLAPSAVQTLPDPVREELERRDCTIPQAFGRERPGNVATGRFTSATRKDIAVLCSRGGISSILVFRRGSAESVAELASAPDRAFLQGMGAGRVGFSRALATADPQAIQKHYEIFGGTEPPPLEHDGIEDIFLEKASKIWYWHAGRWLELTGAD